MLKAIRGVFSPDMSIDLGTANTLVFVKGRGIVLNEPSVVATRTRDSSIVALGQKARMMMGRTPDAIVVTRPLRDGQIADFRATATMLRYFIDRAIGGRFFAGSPRVLICTPCKSTEVEKKAIKDAASGAGAREVFLIEEPLAAAIGANLDIQKARGSMVVDVGGGTSDIAIMALNGIVVSESVRIGGDEFDASIINYVRQQKGCVIGESIAEQIKIKIGTAISVDEVQELTVVGHDLSRGVPRTFKLNSDNMIDALKIPIGKLVEAVMSALQRCPPVISSDIANTGIMMTGGGALLHGIEELIKRETGLPVMIADDPLECVARGCGKILDMDYIDRLIL